MLNIAAAAALSSRNRRLSPSPPPAGGPVTTIQLTSSAGGASVPFSFGQVFAKGDVPSGATLGADTAIQVTVKNTWPDGSARFAIIAGRRSLTAGVPSTMTLSTGGTVASGSALSTSDLQATSAVATIDCGGFGSVSWSGTDWASPFSTWVTGPEMSSWLYRKAVGADAHLVGWLEVRLYAGGAVEILPWIENGYLTVASVTNKSATYSFTLGGTQRYSGAIDLPNHCRTPLLSGTALSHWLGSNPGVVPKHNKAYLQQSKMVPSYRATVVDGGTSVLDSLAASWSPLGQANMPDTMGSAGFDRSIGPLPEWDVLHLVADDARTWPAVNFNAYAAGRYGIHYRDQATNRPFRFSQHPNLALSDGNHGITSYGGSGTGTYTPVAGGTAPPQWANSHHPCVGYFAYLLTGRHFHLETIQFAATLNHLKQSSVVRGTSQGLLVTNTGANTPRGAAWSIRTLTQAAVMTPDDDTTSLRTEFLTAVENNINRYHARYVGQANNAFGFLTPYEDYSSGLNDSHFWSATWQNDFNVFAWGFMAELEPAVNTTRTSQLSAFFAWLAQSIVGRLGSTGATEFLYRDAAQYIISMSPTDAADFDTGAGPWHANWGAVYLATTGSSNPGANGTLRGGNFPETNGYWGNLQPAIAYAVDRGITSALAGYNRMVSESNWSSLSGDMNTNPVWSVKPRTV